MSKPPDPFRAFRTRRSALLLTAGGLIVLGVLAFAGVYYTQFTGSHVSAVSLATPSSSASGSASSSAATSGTGVGTWTVTTGSFAGYRVREQFAILSAPTDAVGRTSSVTGSMTLAQSGSTYTVTATSITVDLTTLTSDRAMRDQRIRQMGLESARYPTATFTLTSPITLPADAATGRVVHVSAVGDLVIHGTTRTVTIPMDARLSGSQIQVTGSLTFPFGEFNMVPPSVGGFVTVQDNATMEFSLLLQHA